MKRRRRLRFRLLALMLGLGIALVVAEVGLRLVWTPPTMKSTIAFAEHPVYAWAPLPGIEGVRATSEYEHGFSHTAQGFRGNRIFDADRPADVERRVLFLGDSFTYGVGVDNDDAFVALLARDFPNYEILNAGCNAYGTRQSLAILDHLGPAFRPDLTVLVFFWNDLGDNLKLSAPDFGVDAEGRVVRLDEVKRRAADPLALRPAARAQVPSKWKVLYVHRLIKEGIRGFRYRLLGRSPRFIRTPEQKEQAWEVTDRLLGLMRLRADELGTELLVASIPGQNRIDPQMRIRNIEPLHFEIEERLALVCARHGIRYVDLTPGMLEAWKTSGIDLYYYADQHLTVEGNRVVARLLRPWIEAPLGGEDEP